jgi:cupin fold WbuC family metalloprotein
MTLRTITTALLDDLIAQAAAHPRRRVPYRFHEHEEPVQRMINAIQPGSYITPHRHAQPPKVELIAILRGQAAVVEFAPEGEIAAVHVLDANGPTRGVDIPPGVIHNFVALTPCAVLEIIQGPYHPDTHKQFADWAPAEGSPAAAAYLKQLEARVRSF